MYCSERFTEVFNRMTEHWKSSLWCSPKPSCVLAWEQALCK